MDVAIERHMDVLERVLKEGTARPRLPRKLTVSWSTGNLELSSQRATCISYEINGMTFEVSQF